MDGYLKQFLLIFTSAQCYDEYFIKYNFFDGECMKTSLSKALGTAIILGSLTVKVPQILKIIKSGSAEGINLTGVVLDLFAMTSNFAYAYVKKFPFSAWGEVVFLALQTAVIAMLILHYTKRDFQVGVFLVSYIFIVYLCMTESVPLNVLWSMQIMNLPIVIVGRGLQIISNYNNKSTGQLSIITTWMQFLGTTVRVFTSMHETADISFVLSFVVCSILNGTVLAQFFIYRKKDEKKLK